MLGSLVGFGFVVLEPQAKDIAYIDSVYMDPVCM